jgi:hypothetical protein
MTVAMIRVTAGNGAHIRLAEGSTSVAGASATQGIWRQGPGCQTGGGIGAIGGPNSRRSTVAVKRIGTGIEGRGSGILLARPFASVVGARRERLVVNYPGRHVAAMIRSVVLTS